MKKNKPEKKKWLVRMRCVVTKEVCVGPCTEEEARDNPWEHSTDETEIDQQDWLVTGVKENA